MKLLKISILKLGERIRKTKKVKRIFLEGNKLIEAGFFPNEMIKISFFEEKNKIEFKLSQNGNIKVTKRKRDDKPVIDIANEKINAFFSYTKQIKVKIYKNKITVEPLEEEQKTKKAKSRLFKRKTPTVLEVFAGGGTLSKAFYDAGYKLKCAIEKEDKYLQNYEKNFKQTFTINAPLELVDIKDLPKTDVLLAGIPCEAYSTLGVAGRKTTCNLNYEAHPTGHLAYFVLKIIGELRPPVVVIEEVPGFKNSTILTLTKSVLQTYGYNYKEDIIKADEYGSLTIRKRYCMVATLSDKIFSFPKIKPTLLKKRIIDILEKVEDREWLTKENTKIKSLFRQEQKHKEKGRSFKLTTLSLSATLCNTITKGYYRVKTTTPLLYENDKYSFFTPIELARLNGLPNNFVLPKQKVLAGEIIGQGVAYEPFYEIAKKIKNDFFNNLQNICVRK